MLKFLTDENFEGAIVQGLLRRAPELDIVRVQDVGLLGATDPEILAWADTESRILLTHDLRTMPRFTYERIAAGGTVTGLILMKHTINPGAAIEEILIIAACTEVEEWINQVMHLPL